MIEPTPFRPNLVTLHCRASSGRHGPERALEEVAPALREQGVETRVLAVYRRPINGPEIHPWVAAVRWAGMAADQVLDPGPLSVEVLRQLARYVATSGAQVLHTHDYKTNILGGLVARRSDRSLPWVATVHLHTTTTHRLRLYRALDLFLLRLADRVVTVSDDQRRLLLGRGVEASRVALVPNVINVDAFLADAGGGTAVRREMGLAAGAPLVSLIGRLTAQKGVGTFLAAAQRIHAARPEVRFLVVGAGPDRAALEARAGALGLAAVVRFLGYRSDVGLLLSASDVVVLPSRAEGLPLVLLEAMATARPVVAARVGGIPEVVRDGETGRLVAPDAPEEVAVAVMGLLGDRETAARMGAAGQDYVRRHHAPPAAARRLASIYRTVVAERI